MSAPRCIVCDKPLAKRTQTVEIREPQPAVQLPSAFGGPSPAREDGDRHSSGSWTTLWLSPERHPRTKEDCQRLSNGTILSTAKWPDGRIMRFAVWDGTSYSRALGGFFCTNKCAIAQGIASAQHGARFTWTKG